MPPVSKNGEELDHQLPRTLCLTIRFVNERDGGIHTERDRASMDAKARRECVSRAFEVRHPKLIAGKRVLLVDDVFTTGAGTID